MQIEEYLYQKDVYLSLSGKTHKTNEMSDGEWEILNQKALRAIRLSLASMVAFNVSTEETTKNLMAVLSKMYEKPSTSNKVFLMKKLFNLKMGGSGSAVGHLNVFNMPTNQLESIEINFEDEIRAVILLSSLPEA